MPQSVKVAVRAEVPPGGKKLVDLDGRAIALFNVDGRFYAIDDVCTHDGGPLAEGDLDGAEIRCPRHGARFDVRTGRPLPARRSSRSTPTPSRSTATRSSSPSTTDPPRIVRPLPRAAEPDRPECLTMPEQDAILDALRTVMDPELNVNIVDLGLIYTIQSREDEVDVEMTLTTPACPAGPEILRNAVSALEKLEGVDKANVKLVMYPPWSHDRMTDAARDELGIF